MNPITQTPPSTPAQLRIISAGAAKGLVLELEPRLLPALSPHSPFQLECSFGAVGAMKDIFLSEMQTPMPQNSLGLVMISSQSILSDLVQKGLLVQSSLTPIGWVSTAMARLEGDERVKALHDEPTLKAALLNAPAIYAPDTQKSTAGIHFKKVLHELNLWSTLEERIQNFPNGAVAMAQMAKDQLHGALGCTQVTEIKYTPGVEVVSLLPKRFELNTLYSAARAVHASAQPLADGFIQWLCGTHPQVQKARLEGGFFEHAS